MNWRGMEGSGCGTIFFYEQFLNFITDIPYVMFPPDIMNKVSNVNGCFEMTSLAEKTEM
jgi:hypothetical protein